MGVLCRVDRARKELYHHDRLFWHAIGFDGVDNSVGGKGGAVGNGEQPKNGLVVSVGGKGGSVGDGSVGSVGVDCNGSNASVSASGAKPEYHGTSRSWHPNVLKHRMATKCDELVTVFKQRAKDSQAPVTFDHIRFSVDECAAELSYLVSNYNGIFYVGVSEDPLWRWWSSPSKYIHSDDDETDCDGDGDGDGNNKKRRRKRRRRQKDGKRTSC